MNWSKIQNGYLFNNNKIQDKLCLNNYNVSTNISKFCDDVDFDLDDITNISYNIFAGILNTTTIESATNLENEELKEHIHTLKISLCIGVEYEAPKGIKIQTFSQNFGDYISSTKKIVDIKIYPLTICLWRDNFNKYNATLAYITSCS
ncbi:MAG: hypothetical protein ACRC68_12355 [Clostridium sp.]